MTEYDWPLMKDTLTWCDRWNLAKFVMTADRFTQGKKVEEFEEAWSKWLGVNRSLYVTSGSTANFLLLDAVRELYFKDKKEIKVLLPACTWVTNINPVMQLGMTPVFCDIDLRNYSFDYSNAKAIAAQHEIDIVFATHLLGLDADISTLRFLFPKAIILEDVCESHGAKDTRGYKSGTQGEGSTFSFYFGHHMSTIEGGMVCTNIPELYNLMRMKRSHGMSRVSTIPDYYAEKHSDIDPQFLFVTSGYNFRNTELGAVLGLSQLRKLDGFIAKRQENYDRFVEVMNKSDKFWQPWRAKNNSSFCFPMIAKDRKIKEKLIEQLKAHGIEYRPIVGGNLLRQPYMKGYKIACNDGPYNADLLHDNGIYIGNNQFVGEKELALLEKIIGSL